jgi:aminopeptidase N
MKDRAYSNATSVDLWNALSKASGNDIGKLANLWINQPGFPIVSVASSCDASGARTIKLSQQRFLLEGSDSAHQRWNIPLRLRIGADGQAQSVLLTEEGQTLAAGRCDQALSINANADGFFRTAYDSATLRTNTQQFRKLPAGDRIAMLDDQWAQVENGTQPLSDYLALAAAQGDDPNERAWSQIMEALSVVEHAERGTAGHAAFVAYASELLKPVATRLGWQPAAEETAGVQRLRRNVLARLGAWGDKSVVAEARKRFAAFVADPKALSPDDQATILTIVSQNADAATFTQLHAIAKASANETEVRRYYPILMRVRDPQLAAQAAAIALSPEIPPQADVLRLGLVFGLNEENPQLSWKTFTENVDKLTAPNPGSRPNVLAKNIPGVYWNSVPLDQMSNWITGRIDAGMKETLASSLTLARFRLHEQERLQQQAKQITGG